MDGAFSHWALLPQREAVGSAKVWWVGVHGGAGESTLATLAAGTRPADHAWPLPSTAVDTVHRVVLVARTNYSGLVAAQHAASHWATGTVGTGIELAGLVLIADAPGRLPKGLRELAEVITGGVPRTWLLPWVPAWRLGPVTPTNLLPKEFGHLFTDLSLTAQQPPPHN